MDQVLTPAGKRPLAIVALDSNALTKPCRVEPLAEIAGVVMRDCNTLDYSQVELTHDECVSCTPPEIFLSICAKRYNSITNGQSSREKYVRRAMQENHFPSSVQKQKNHF